MYHFAVVALLGLAVLTVGNLLDESVPGVNRVRALLAFGLGIGAAAALDYSVFEGFGIAIREQWLGVAGTGVVIGSLATAWKALFTYLGSSEGDVAGRDHRDRPRIAA